MPANDFYVTAISSAILSMLSMITSSYLFLQRVQAVYADTRWVRWLFFVLWVMAVASDAVIPLGIHPESIRGTHYQSTNIPRYDALSVFTLLFFDTSVLIAISYKLASRHRSVPTTGRVPWCGFISGKSLPHLSRAVLRGGQQYYLQAIQFNLHDTLANIISGLRSE